MTLARLRQSTNNCFNNNSHYSWKRQTMSLFIRRVEIKTAICTKHTKHACYNLTLNKSVSTNQMANTISRRLQQYASQLTDKRTNRWTVPLHKLPLCGGSLIITLSTSTTIRNWSTSNITHACTYLLISYSNVKYCTVLWSCELSQRLCDADSTINVTIIIMPCRYQLRSKMDVFLFWASNLVFLLCFIVFYLT